MQYYKPFVLILLGLFFVISVIFITLASTPLTPLSLSYPNANVIYTLVPQGFGFFTRDPQEVQVLAYTKTEEGYTLLNKSNATPSYLFGLSRTSRKENIELGYIMGQLNPQQWRTCSENWITCIPDTIVNVKSGFDNPLVTGELLLVSKKPVPWAWSRAEKIEMPCTVIRINIQ